MIDTDKYTRHSEMIDANEIGEIWEYLADTISEDSRGRAEANYNLVADAPDLLAEVKRLREQGRKLVEAAERVRSEISDQDTGWYYQLGNHIEKMNRLVKE